MAFDLSTAKPVQQSNGFDISTAKPVVQGNESKGGFGTDALNVAGEFAAGVNRVAADTADFFTTDQVNAILELAGSDKRVPSIRGTLEPTGIEGGFMQEGLPRDIVRSAGETAALATGFQGALKTAGRNLPAIQPAAESVGRGVLRTLGAGTTKQAATAGALSGAGAEVGEEVGGETGRLAGSLVAPIAPAAIKSGASALTKNLIRGGESSRKALQSRVGAFAESGATPNLGQALNSNTIEGAQTVSGSFLGGAPLRRHLDVTRQKIQSRLGSIADDMSTIKGDEAAGRVIQESIKGKGGFIDRFNAKSGGLWSKVDGKIGDESVVALNNTRKAFDSMTNRGAFGDVLNNPIVSKLSSISKTTGDSVPYSELKALRSQIGRKISNNELISDIPRAELKQLYGAITEDIKTVAASRGAGAEFARANRFTRTGHKRIGDFVERVAKKVKLEDIFAAVAKGGEGSQTINAFKRSMKPQEWDVVASNVVRNLGKPTAGNQSVSGDGFSINSFVTQWNKLGPAKKALFSGSKKLNEYSANLDRVARSAQLIKDDTVAQANPSGSGVFAANVGTAGGFGLAVASGEPITAASILSLVAVNNRAAALMSSPRFVRWLAKSSNLKDAQIPAHIGRLAVIAEGSDSEDILSFLDAIEESQTETQPQQTE